MQAEHVRQQSPPPESGQPVWQQAVAARTWQASLLIGLFTLAVGIVVAFHPSGSLNVVAVLLGVLSVVSGLIHLVRVFDRSEEHRGWLGGVGLLLIVLGVVLMRHIDLTTAVIGLLIGVTWIVQGLVWLLSGLSARTVRGHGWWVFFGGVSLAAGIVVTATPTSSVTALASLVGIWFAILGVAEIIGAFMLRHVNGRAHTDLVNARRSGRAGASGPV
jgi:uncharacterized membrane protein HdeD (DUF308 family)